MNLKQYGINMKTVKVVKLIYPWGNTILQIYNTEQTQTLIYACFSFSKKNCIEKLFSYSPILFFLASFLLQYLDVYYTDSVKVKKTSETFALLVMNEYILDKRMNNSDQFTMVSMNLDLRINHE